MQTQTTPLEETLKRLILEATWNATSKEAHATKVIIATLLHQLVPKLEADLARLKAQDIQGVEQLLPELKKYQPRDIELEMDRLIFDTPLLAVHSIKLNLHNLSKLSQFQRTALSNQTLNLMLRDMDKSCEALFTDFNTDLRGNILDITPVPFSHGTCLIIKTLVGNNPAMDAIHYYVTAPNKAHLTASMFHSFNHAVCYALNPNEVTALYLLSNARKNA